MSLARGGAIVLWLLGLAACVLIIMRGGFSTDMSAFLPRSPVPAQQILVEQMRDGVISRMVLVGIADAEPPVLAALSKAMAKALRGAPELGLVANGEDVGMRRDQDFIWRNRYLLSPGVVPEQFTAAGLRQALENDLQLLGSDAGMMVKRTLPNDPTGEILALIDVLAGGQQPASRDGVWFAKDGATAVMMVQTRAAGFDIDGQEHGLALIEQAFAAAKQAVGAPGAKLLLTGAPVFAVHARAMIESDATRFSLIATVLVATLLVFAYRRPGVVLLALCPVVSGAVAGIASVSLGFGYVHGITLGFGVTLIGEAVDYAVYLFTQTVPGSPPAATLPRIWPTLRLGMLTSVSGFSAMLLSSFTGFAQLGLFTIVGLVVALAVTRWILPLLLPRDFANRTSTIFAPPLLALIRHAPRLRIIVWFAVAAGLASLALHRGGMWEDEIESMSPISAADKALDAKLRKSTAAPDVRYLLAVEAPSVDAALATSTRVSAFLSGLVVKKEIAGFDAPQLILPSQATQRARQAALPAPEVLRANLEQALDGLPFRFETFAPFLADVEAARKQKLLDRASLAGTSLATKLNSLLVRRNGGWMAMILLRGVADAPRLADEIAAGAGKDVVFLDLKGESDRLLATYLHEAVMLSLIGGLVIVVLLSVSLRSARRVGTVLAPLAAAVVVTGGILAFGAQKLSIFNLFGLLLVVAVGSNYCLFFERRATIGENRERTLASLMLANLCTVIGFGVLAFSHVPVLYGIGETVAIGALLSLGFAAVLTAPRDALPGGAVTIERILLVALPGAYMAPTEFAAAGFDRMLAERDLPVDFLAAAIDSGLYLDGVVSERLRDTVILPASENGRRRIWLLAISLGGMGALQYLREYPGEIEGVILIAPFLGTRGLIAEIERAGGLAAWYPGVPAPGDIERPLLRWLRAQNFMAGGSPAVYLGCGRDDRFAAASALLAARLPPERVVSAAGRHDWPGWTQLWQEILALRPFAAR